MKASSKQTQSPLREARIERILETTRSLLTEIGPDKITIRGLAAASGVAPATLYNRFGGKEQLISLAVIDHYERYVRQGFLEHAGAGSPLENFIHGLKLLAETCHLHRTFAATAVGMYFKVGELGDAPKAMHRALFETWLLLFAEMRRQDALRAWISLDRLTAEMCERAFAVTFKWAQGEITDEALFDRLLFGTLSILLGASSSKQVLEVEQTLRALLDKPGFSPPIIQLKW